MIKHWDDAWYYEHWTEVGVDNRHWNMAVAQLEHAMMIPNFIEGLPGWFSMWPGSIGHRCGYNVFRVTFLSRIHCKCGVKIPTEVVCTV